MDTKSDSGSDIVVKDLYGVDLLQEVKEATGFPETQPNPEPRPRPSIQSITAVAFLEDRNVF